MNEEQAFQDALDYVYSLVDARNVPGYVPWLERFTALCERLGNPQDNLRIVHVAGTNGKGSTAAMISSILKSAGYRVGTYYSPYVYNIRERVMLDGGMISKQAFTRLIDTIKPHAAAIGETDLGHPTEFEVKTALGLMYFVEQQVDFAVLEVGMGGRLDATNITNPMVSVITNVFMDHMDRLGNTIAEIAAEKAGIIKRNGRTVTAAEHPDAFEVIRRTCEERNSTLRRVSRMSGSDSGFRIEMFGREPEPFAPEVGDEASGTIIVRGLNGVYSDIKLRMQGEFQQVNAATAIAGVEVLQEQGIEVPDAAIRKGLEHAYLPGRLEVLRTKPTLMIDGAHNVEGARTLARALEHSFQYDRLFLVMGMVCGHTPDDVVGTLAPLAHRFYATAADSVRATPATAIAEIARRHCPDVEEVRPVCEAVSRALKSAGENDLVCVTGSFYVIGEVPRPPDDRTAEF